MNLANTVICIIILKSASTLALAQSRNFKIYSINEGLPSSTVYCVFQDSNGYIWFASSEGVSKYDGYQFHNYTVTDGLSDSEVFDFYEDHLGRIWFYTLNGKVSYYLREKIYNSKIDSALLGLDSETMITSIFEDASMNIWISTFRNGLLKYSLGGDIQRFLVDDNLGTISAAFPISSNHIELITRFGLYKFIYRDDSLLVVDKIDPPSGNEELHFSKYTFLTSEDFWFSDRGAVYQSNVKSGTFELIFGEEFSDIHVNNICRVDSEMWVCTNSGAYKQQKEKSFFPAFLDKYEISSVLKDHEGNYWFGTIGHGALYFPSKNIYGYSGHDGLLEDNVIHLSQDNEGKVWFAYSRKGIGSIKDKKIVNMPNSEKMLKNKGRINKMFFYEEEFWLASDFGVLRIDNFKLDYLRITSKDLLIDTNKEFWMASSEGLFAFHKEVFDQNKNRPKNYQAFISKYRLIDKRVQKLFLDNKENIWISTRNNVYIKPYRKQKLEKVPGLEGININAFAEFPQGSMLLATDGSGIVNIVNDDSLQFINIGDGLSSNTCYALVVDEDGIIWVATNNGINRIIGFPNDIVIDYFNKDDGFGTDIINDLLIVNDTVWVATPGGLFFFSKAKLRVAQQSPEIHIKSIIVNGQPYDCKKDIQLKHNQNDIIVKFIGISPKSRKSISYRYKINNESPWRFTRNTFINFSSLSPGYYQFTVSAKGKSGNWSEDATLSFIISKPFWQSTVFLIFLLLLLLIIALLTILRIINYHHRQQLQEKKMVLSEIKSLKAQINTHFLSNTINSIQGELFKNKPDVAQSYLIKLGKLLRQVLDHSDNIFVSLTEEIEIITNYLEIECFKTGYEFEYTIEISPEIDTYSAEVPSMVIQPFLENAIRHGFTQNDQKNRLLVKFDMDKYNRVEVLIHDNGIGRKKARKLANQSHVSKGIRIVHERIEAINFGKINKILFNIKDLECEDDQHSGTIVLIKIPQ